MTNEELADALYTEYCVAVGGVNFQGDPLPDWQDFATDPKKEKQANAWLVVARTAKIALDKKL